VRRELLDRLTTARVTQLLAPAGSGKSSLVRSWIDVHALADRVAWVTVPRDTRDAEQFWNRVVDALRATRVGARRIRASGAYDRDHGPTRLIEDLSQANEGTWLVIDDLHELRSDRALCLLEELLLNAPATLQFVLISRLDVPVGLHRIRLAGELADLRWSDLRFTFADSRALFEAAGLRLSDGAVESLQRRTDGWAAGLRLAALALARHPEPEWFAAEFSGNEHSVHQYVLAEVLEPQSADVKRFLLHTCLLSRVNGALGDLLTGDSRGEAMLAELEANGLATALDEQRTWFRYHPLLVEVLRVELRRSSAAELMRLHAVAAGWYALHDHPIEAIRHAQAAQDRVHAARLISDHALLLEMRGEHATVRELLAQFPAAAFQVDAELAMLKAFDETRRGSVHEAARCIALAAQHLVSVPADRRVNAEVRLTAVRLEHARHCGDLPMMFDQARKLLVRADGPDAAKVAGMEELRAFALIGLGIARSWTEPGASDGCFEEGVRIARRREVAHLEVLALAHWSMTASLRSPSVAVDRSRNAIALARQHGWSETAVVAPAYLALGLVSVWRGAMDDADRWLGTATRALAGESEPALDCLFHFARGTLELARGDNRQAMTAHRAATQHAERLLSTHPLSEIVRAELLHASLRFGDSERVVSAMSTMNAAERERPALHLVLGSLQLVQGEPASASRALAKVHDERDRPLPVVSSIRALLLEAIAREALRDRSQSERCLEHALDLAETEGVLWPFLVEREVRGLLERHVQRRTAHAHLVRQVLDTLGGSRPRSRAFEAQPRLVEPLSASELRVLRHLPTNLSAPEIGRELFVSVNTVKTHMRHIYAKLGAHGRTEAVEAARGLGLLAPSTKRSMNAGSSRVADGHFRASFEHREAVAIAG
jgi:LuxR family maltose regulon positive regulatory protein